MVYKAGSSKIPFITRIAPNRTIYKELAAGHTRELRTAKYAVKYGERLVYVKKVSVELYGHKAYAYIAIDDDIVQLQHKKAVFHAMEDKLTPEQIDARLTTLGVFILISSEDMEESEVLSLYYTRQQMEQVFDITKNYADLTPLRTEDEASFRGHLMLTIHKCKVYNQSVVPQEATAKANQVYDLFKIKVPQEIPIASTRCK